MSEQNQARLQQARAAIKRGDKPHARHLLQQALRQDRTDHLAWLLLASITPEPRKAQVYVQQAAQIKPDSPTVKKAMAWAASRLEVPTHTTAPVTTPATVPIPVSAPEAETPPPVRTPAADTPLAIVPTPSRRGLLWGGVGAVAALLLITLAVIFWPRASAEETAVATIEIAQESATPVPASTRTDIVPTATVIAATATTAPTTTPTSAPYIPAKQINQSKEDGSEGPRSTWTLTPSPTPSPTPTHTPMPTFVAPQESPLVVRPFGVGPNERWVDVNLTTQTLVAMEGDKPVLNTLISSGTWEFPTVTGQFRIYLAYQSQTMDGRRLGYDYYLENVPYVMYFFEDYALHGTFWHSNFGNPMSHGCVNMETSEAGWLYNWASIGTLVNVHY